MIFFILTLAVSAFMYAFRTLSYLYSKNQIKLRTRFCIEGIFFISWLMFGLWFPIKIVHVIAFSLAWLLAMFAFVHLCEAIKQAKARESLERFVDRCILHLLAGNSFKFASFEAARTGDAFSQQEISKQLTSVFARENSPQSETRVLRRLNREWKFIETSPHASLSRLKSFRRTLSLESEFRQKSEQIGWRVRIQAMFMLGLYVATWIYLWKQNMQINFVSGAVSVTFFVTGFFWTLLDGRRMTWKT
jgi:hypothetical protein